MKKISCITILLLSWFTHLSAFEVNIPVTYKKLNNGLKVIIVPDSNVAVVSCKLYYFMGSMYEGPGTSGLSHMYEHMMFKGTKVMGTSNYMAEVPYMNKIDSIDNIIVELRQQGVSEADSQIVQYRKDIFSLLDEQRKYIKKDEIWNTYLHHGGTGLNAWTSDDLTAYTVTLPKNKLELFFWIESDRMANPVLREFYSERDVVTEERGMRTDNRPIGKYWEKLSSLFYTAHPYRIPTIGWMSDIRGYTRKKMAEHVNRYYTPDNALLVLVGNVNTEKALSQIQTYFGSLEKSTRPKDPVVTREPASLGEVRFTMHDQSHPRIDMMYQTPGYPHNDLYSLDILESILSGRSGRLYRRLVNEEKLCTSAGAGNGYKLHNGYFHVWAGLKSDADPKKVEAIILEEIEKLKKEGPTERELMRIKNSLQLGFVKKLRDLEGLSDQLAFFETLGSWKDLIEYPKKIDAVKPENIPSIAQKYLKEDFRTIGLLLPQKDKKGDK